MMVQVLSLRMQAMRRAAMRSTHALPSPVTSRLHQQPATDPNLGSSANQTALKNGVLRAYRRIPVHRILLSRRLTTTMTRALEISVATADDLEQVLALRSDVYEGLDYVPFTFPHLVDRPGATGYLFRRDGELVAFHSTLLLDRGQSMLFEAARVKDSLQGQGLYKEFLMALVKQVSKRQLYPHLRRLIFNSARSVTQLDCQLVLTLRRTSRAFPASSLSHLTLRTPPGRVSALTWEEVRQLFQSDPTRWSHLFPGNQFVLALKPYTVMTDNIPVIQSSGWNTQFYGTRDEDGQYTLLSAGSWVFCQVGVSYHVDVFGNVGRDTRGVSWDARKGQLRTLSASDDSSNQTSQAPIPGRLGTADKNILRPSTENVGKEELETKSDTLETTTETGSIPVASRSSKDIQHRALPRATTRLGSQDIRNHLITHLLRLRSVRSILSGTVVFDVYASGSVEEVMEEVTQELENTLFDSSGDVCWIREVKVRG